MTKQEAKIALQAGCILTHSYFTDDEFIYLKDGKIHDENGYNIDAEFWALRWDEAWQTGWEIKKPPLMEEPIKIFQYKNYYKTTQQPKPQNNEKCSCGSGLKFKNCCKM